jgi:hypothetical protein
MLVLVSVSILIGSKGSDRMHSYMQALLPHMRTCSNAAIRHNSKCSKLFLILDFQREKNTRQAQASISRYLNQQI